MNLKFVIEIGNIEFVLKMANRKRDLSDAEIRHLLVESEKNLSNLDSDDSKMSFNSSRVDVRENVASDDRQETVQRPEKLLISTTLQGYRSINSIGHTSFILCSL